MLITNSGCCFEWIWELLLLIRRVDLSPRQLYKGPTGRWEAWERENDFIIFRVLYHPTFTKCLLQATQYNSTSLTVTLEENHHCPHYMIKKWTVGPSKLIKIPRKISVRAKILCIKSGRLPGSLPDPPPVVHFVQILRLYIQVLIFSGL